MKKFYDIHAHTFDLSHPNLSAFIMREDLINGIVDKLKCKDRFRLSLGSIFATKKCIKKKIIGFLHKPDKNGKSPLQRIDDTLAFFEIPHEYQFLVMDYLLSQNNPLAGRYDKIVLCPLIMDFGYKNNQRLMPKHPIAKQTGDMLYAVRTYFRFNVAVQNNKIDLSPEIKDWENKKAEKLFEIYPFMGMNTQNYELDDIKNLLNKYFNRFRNEDAVERRNRLFDKMGKLSSNLYGDTESYKEKHCGIGIDYSDAFAGIKVYPQLGFDPYPELAEERKKVEFLYETCVEKRIPVITHCSDGGYKTEKDNECTKPSKWEKVLKDFPALTLDFAHFGSQKDKKCTEWRQEIIELTKKYTNVYTDISCNDMSAEYYGNLEKDIANNAHLQQKLLYGSDFSINLLVTNTNRYNDNLEKFINSGLSSTKNVCEINPEIFLFGNQLI